MPGHSGSARASSAALSFPIERLVGQVLMVGFPGIEPPAGLLGRIESGEAGNVILFSRNVESPDQTRRLVRRLQDAAIQGAAGRDVHVGLLVSTDQEGGRVARLKPPATWFPSNMALGAIGDPVLVERLALAMGRQLRAAGINMDLAPVLDVNNNPDNPVIGLRSYGKDAERVARLGSAAVRGLRAAGVAATAKHFPGHGDTAVDSHADLPVVAHDRARLDRVELVPFRAAIAAGVDAVMTAHVVFPAVEPDPGRPATHSRAVLEGLLRRDLGFEGVIITDCLEMRAISDRFEPGEAAVRSFEAGADLVLVSHTESRQRAAYAALLRAVREGRITEDRLRASAARILALKERLGLVERGLDAMVPDVPFQQAVDVAAGDRLAGEAAVRAATIARAAGTWPGLSEFLRLRGRSGVLVLELGEGVAAVAEERGETSLRLAGALLAELSSGPAQAAVRELRIPAGVTPEALDGECQQLRRAVEQERLLPVVVTRSASRCSDQLEWVQRAMALAPRDAVVVAMGTPYEFEALAASPATSSLFLAVYGDRPPHVRAAAAVLAGRVRGEGELPV